MPGHARHEPEDGVVWARQPAQQLDDRQADGREHAVQHTEHQHGDRGDEREHSSLRRNRAIRRNSPTSINRIAAKITTAPSAAVRECGQHGRPTRG